MDMPESYSAPYFQDAFGAKDGFRVFGATQSFIVSNIIGAILGGSLPTEICQKIIGIISIPVGALMRRAWARAYKSLTYHDGNGSPFFQATLGKRGPEVAPPSWGRFKDESRRESKVFQAGLRVSNKIINGPPNAAVGTDFVIRESDYGAPLFQYSFLLFIFLIIQCNDATAQLLTTGAGCQPAVCASGSTYQGPLDVVSGATAWYGLRGASAAYSTGSNNAINIRRASDNSTSNIVILSNGNLDTATAATFAGTDATATCSATASTSLICTGASSTPHSNDPISGTGVTQPAYITSCGTFTGGAGTCTLNASATISSTTITFQVALFATEAYDQSGNTKHITQSTSGSQPQLLLSGVSSLPVLRFDISGTASLLSGTITTGVTQPFTLSAVSYTTTTSGEEWWFNTYPSSGILTYHRVTSTTSSVYCGSDVTATIGNNTWNAVQGVCNGASSAYSINGTGTTGNAGSTTSGTAIGWGAQSQGALANPLVGYSTEGGLWPVAFSSGQQTSMYGNQHTYWGF